MIAIISEYRYSVPELRKLQEQKAVINYTLLPQFYQSYAEEITRINYSIIRRTEGVVFRLEDYYAGTKEAIEYALYLKKPVKIITPEGKTYKLCTKEEWKHSYKEPNKRNVTIKHQVLIDFEEKRNAYYEVVNTAKLTDKYNKATEGITDTKEEIERFVKAFAPQYKVDVNYSDWPDVCLAYKSLKFYYDNNLPYELDYNEMYSRGSITPEDTLYFTAEMFEDTSPDYDSYEEELFGNETLLEDMIYKGGVLV